MRKLYFLILFIICVSASQAQIAPKANPDTATLAEGTIDTIAVLINDINYNPTDSIRITNVWGAPAGWASVLDSTRVLYHTNNIYYYGLDTFYYRACDTRIAGLCDTGLILVNVIRVPFAANDTIVLDPSGQININVLANDSNFSALSPVCVDSIWGLPAGWGSIVGCGQILYQPLNDSFPVLDTFYYSLCYTQAPVLCSTGMIIVESKPLTDFTWYEQDSLCITQVYNNSLLSDSVTWTVRYLSNNGQNEALGNVDQFQISSTSPDSGYNVEICQTAYNAIGDSTVCYSFWIQCTTGINEVTASHVIIYPNPASDRIRVNLSGSEPSVLSDISTIMIYDMVGKELKAIPFGEINNGISVSDLSPGIYLIALLDRDGSKKLLTRFEVIR